MTLDEFFAGHHEARLLFDFELYDPADVDGRVRGWLEEAWASAA